MVCIFYFCKQYLFKKIYIFKKYLICWLKKVLYLLIFEFDEIQPSINFNWCSVPWNNHPDCIDHSFDGVRLSHALQCPNWTMKNIERGRDTIKYIGVMFEISLIVRELPKINFTFEGDDLAFIGRRGPSVWLIHDVTNGSLVLFNRVKQ